MFYLLDQNFGSRILVLVICYCKFTTLWKKFLNLYCIQINVGKYSSIVHTEVVLREYDCASFVAEKKKLMQLLARILKGAKLFKLLRDTISSKVGIGTFLSSVGNILKCIIFQTDQIEDCWCGTNWLLTSQFNVEFCAFASEWKVPNNIFSRQPEYNFFNRAHQPFSFFFFSKWHIYLLTTQPITWVNIITWVNMITLVNTAYYELTTHRWLNSRNIFNRADTASVKLIPCPCPDCFVIDPLHQFGSRVKLIKIGELMKNFHGSHFLKTFSISHYLTLIKVN